MLLNLDFAASIASTLNLRTPQVTAVLNLLNEGATIPFIARYRKDKTGNLDEVVIQLVEHEVKALTAFTERKAFITESIRQQDKLTPEVEKALNTATTLAALEDIYLPYKPRRKTKAQTARENGLEPLADTLMAQLGAPLELEAKKYINENVAGIDEALQGARDIVSERISEDAENRAGLRSMFQKQATLQASVVPGKETEAIKFKDYFSYEEPVHKVPAHRALAVMRGFMEGLLRMRIGIPEDEAFAYLEKQVLKKQGTETPQLQRALKDAYRRLLEPALETEMRTALKARSDEEAIEVFAENLRQLLLGSPLGAKRILAIDPGLRTGCKTVMLGVHGELLHTTVVYVHEANRLHEAEREVRKLVAHFKPEAIAIGDGTAGRETEKFIRSLALGLQVFMVNEDGASIYSASEVARQEFPNEDITVRGAVSIGRRLMDPLAELVKIEPKSIGVGQYQHDVNQTRLKEKLDATVISVVNQVGVNVNTASQQLLAYVSGIGDTIAKNIVEYRNTNGGFAKRSELKKVPRLGDKAFEQCAGFLRIPSAKNPLDASGVHPESYALVEQMAAEAGVSLQQLVGSEDSVKKIDAKHYRQHGEHTVNDILRELRKPGLDPRSEATAVEFAAVYSISDLQVGMVLPGVVTNLTRFGAFVDVGVKQDGLVHISELAHRYIADPAEVLKLGQQVRVKVTELDAVRKRIALSIKQTLEPAQAGTKSRQAPVRHAEPANMHDALQALKKRLGK